MNIKLSKKTLAATFSVLVASSFAGTVQADANPLATNELGNGYLVAGVNPADIVRRINTAETNYSKAQAKKEHSNQKQVKKVKRKSKA